MAMHLSTENGFTRYDVSPTARICAWSRRVSRAVNIKVGTSRSLGSRFKACTSSKPFMRGMS